MTTTALAKAFLGPPLTEDYKPSSVGSPALWLDQRGWFTLHDVERMRRDPQIQLGLRILRAPLPTVTWEVSAHDARVGAYVDRTLKRIWQRELVKLTRFLEYGSCGGEVVWHINPATDLIEFKELKDIYLFDMRPLAQHGQLAGISVHSVEGKEGRPLWLRPPRSLWISNEPEFGQHYGRSRLSGAWNPWMEKVGRHGALDVRRLWYVKNAYRGGKMRHPIGMIETAPGVYQSNQDYAREIAEKVETGGIMVLPNIRDEHGNPLWDYEEPKINGDLRDIRDYPKDLDTEMLKGMGIPPEVVEAATSGSGWSGRSVPFLVYLTSEDQLADTTFQALDAQVLRLGVRVNFGDKAHYEVQLKSLVPASEDEGGSQQPGQPPSPGGPPQGGGLQPYSGPRGGQGQRNPVTGRIVYQSRLSLDRFAQGSGDPWQSYEGPHGGKGWRNGQTGEVLYQQEKPGQRVTGQEAAGSAPQGEQPTPQTGQPPAAKPNAVAQLRQQVHSKRLLAREPGAPIAQHLERVTRGEARLTDLTHGHHEATADALARSPGHLAGLLAQYDPWQGSDTSTPQGKEEATLDKILRTALARAPAQPKQSLSARNFEQGYLVDLSTASPEERQRAQLALKLTSPADALTGKGVRVVYPPRGMDPAAFEDYLSSIPGLQEALHLGDQESEAVPRLYELSVAPEQVAVSDVPMAARGINQSDAADFHVDNVATYKRISRGLYLKHEVQHGQETYELLGKDEVPELSGLPREFLDRSRAKPTRIRDTERGQEETAERAKAKRERKARLSQNDDPWQSYTGQRGNRKGSAGWKHKTTGRVVWGAHPGTGGRHHAERPTLEATHARIQETLSHPEQITAASIRDLTEHLLAHSVQELEQLKGQLNLHASGRKEELARKISERVLGQEEAKKAQAALEQAQQKHETARALHKLARARAKGQGTHSRAALEAHQAELAAIRAHGKFKVAQAEARRAGAGRKPAVQPAPLPAEKPAPQAAKPAEEQPSPIREEGALPERPEPGKVYNAPLGDLHVDPARFQFKLNVDKSGVTQELKNVQTFNPDFAGVISVWQDPADGKTYVVNGHHRHELAGRLGHPELAVRYVDAKDARAARAVGALINIAEGRGTAVDAAKFLRDSGVAPEDLAQHGVSLKGKVAGDAATLTRLGDRLFNKLALGTLDQDRALAIAGHLPDEQRQELLLGLIEKQEDKTGREIPPKVVAEMAREVESTPRTTKTEKSLFGDEEVEESLFVPRNELKAYVRGELAREQKDFSAVSSQRRAEKVQRTGNVLQVEQNKAQAEQAGQASAAYATLVNLQGPISDALNESAAQYAHAKSQKERDAIKRQTAERVRQLTTEVVGGGKTETDRGSLAPGSAERTAVSAPLPPDAGRGSAQPIGLTEPLPLPAGDEARYRKLGAHQVTARQAHEVLDAVRKADRHGLANLRDVQRLVPHLSREQLHAAIQRLRLDGILTGSNAEGRHGVTPEEQAIGIPEDTAGTGKGLVLYVSERDPEKTKDYRAKLPRRR